MVPHPRLIAGLADEALDFFPRQPEAHPGGGHYVLLDHRAAEVIGAEMEGDLPELGPLGHPGRLQVLEVVQRDPRDGQGAQIVIVRRPRGRRGRYGPGW